MAGAHQHNFFCISYWHSYPERRLHTASCQSRMAGTPQHKLFAVPIGTATPNDVYTQQAAKAAWQEHLNTKFLQLLLAQLPRTTFTFSKLPKPHGRNTSTQFFCSSYWHSYPERRLHTTNCQSRTAGTPQHKIFAPPIGTATPNDVYTQQAAKAARQEHLNTKFLHLLLAQLPRTTFTHSKLPKPHGRNTSTRQSFGVSYWHSYPERRLHTASCQTRMAGRPATQTGQAQRSLFWRL